MKKNSSNSMFSKYSDTPSKKSRSAKTMPLMTTYEQRYKSSGSMSKEITEPKSVPTLEEKIEARKTRPLINNDLIPNRVSVEIAGHNYLLGSNDAMSEARIRRVASLVNKLLTETKENNPGLTNSKITTLALLEACDRLVSAQDENSNNKTELMYLQQKLSFEEVKKPKDPTPMELLANEMSDTEEEKQ